LVTAGGTFARGVGEASFVRPGRPACGVVPGRWR